jgi:hypothetical protein
MSIKEQVIEIIDSVHPDEAIAGVSIEFVRWLKHKIQAIPDEVTVDDTCYVFNKAFKPSQIACEIVEQNFPVEKYGDIMTFEAWDMRTIMEQLVEIGLRTGKTDEVTVRGFEKIKELIKNQKDMPEDFEAFFQENWKDLLA